MLARRTPRGTALATTVALALAVPLATSPPTATADTADGVFVNELHYDNDGTDTGEAIELAGPAGTDLGEYRLVLYNGANGEVYDSRSLSGSLPDQQGGMGTTVVSYGTNGIQNGPGDAVALVHGGDVIQFIGYEGTVTASEGPAGGMRSTDIGVQETSSTPAGHSLQLTGTGTGYGDFTWAAQPAPASFGEVNDGQTFGDGPPDGDPPGGGDPSPSCTAEHTPTFEIQGDGATSPLLGERVAVEGVVSADLLGGDEFGGFYIQDASGDGNPATSDGLFVYAPDAQVSVGDVVRVVGTVDEYYDLTQINRVDSLRVCGSGDISPTELDLPIGTDGREAHEGMLVTIPEALSVTDTYNLHTYGEVLLSSGGVLHSPTDVAEPGSDEAEAIRSKNERRSLLLDDGRDIQLNRPPYPMPPYLGDDGTLRRGATVEGLTGILGYGFGDYRIQPTRQVHFDPVPRPKAPEDVGGTISVASFNVLNYFTTIDHPGQDYEDARGADSVEEFRRQEAKIVSGILALNADVVALQEIEDGVASGAEPPPVQVLVDALNQAADEGRWAAVGLPDNYDSHNPIRNAIIYRADRVDLVGEPVADVDPIWSEDRQPIAATFNADGEVFTVISNHFKSKGSCPPDGPNSDQGDGQGCWNARRVKMSRALLDFVDELQQRSGDPDVIAIGDFNAYAKEDPIDVLKQGGLVSVMQRHERNPYTYVYFGMQGSLDHAFVTPSLARKVTGGDIWHINSDEPRALDYHNEELLPDDPYHTPNQPGLYSDGPYRSSDHDPLLVGFCDGVAPRVDVRMSETVLWPPNGRYRWVTAELAGPDADGDLKISLVSADSDEPDWGFGYGFRPFDIIPVDDTHLLLRAERGRLGDGRVYTLTYEVTDTCGNTTRVSATVKVPKHR